VTWIKQSQCYMPATGSSHAPPHDCTPTMPSPPSRMNNFLPRYVSSTRIPSLSVGEGLRSTFSPI
jgi:hypothetical protein